MYKTAIQPQTIMDDAFRHRFDIRPLTIWELAESDQAFLILDYTLAKGGGWSAVVMLDLQTEQRYRIEADIIIDRIKRGRLTRRIVSPISKPEKR